MPDIPNPFTPHIAPSTCVGRYAGGIGDTQPAARAVSSLFWCDSQAVYIAAPSVRNARSRSFGDFPHV